jgi:hypothetical protein
MLLAQQQQQQGQEVLLASLKKKSKMRWSCTAVSWSGNSSCSVSRWAAVEREAERVTEKKTKKKKTMRSRRRKKTIRSSSRSREAVARASLTKVDDDCGRSCLVQRKSRHSRSLGACG